MKKFSLRLSLLVFVIIFSGCASAPLLGGRSSGFKWKNIAGDHLDLMSKGQPVIRYMYAFDPSDASSLFRTYKPFTHVFDKEGVQLTNGAEGLYPHHRGLFIGWNKLNLSDKVYDFWHMKGVNQVHQKFLKLRANSKGARMVALISWNDPDQKAVIEEEREILVHPWNGSELILDCSFRLKAVQGDVVLDGDPEHAGFHFRPHSEVAERAAKIAAEAKEAQKKGAAVTKNPDETTYLFHKDGVDPHKDRDLPWAAMSFVRNGKRYTVQHLNHPKNPGPTLYSAYRDYGRFGAFAKTDIKNGETLNLSYRVIVEEGDLPSRDVLNARYEEWIK